MVGRPVKVNFRKYKLNKSEGLEEKNCENSKSNHFWGDPEKREGVLRQFGVGRPDHAQPRRRSDQGQSDQWVWGDMLINDY